MWPRAVKGPFQIEGGVVRPNIYGPKRDNQVPPVGYSLAFGLVIVPPSKCRVGDLSWTENNRMF